MPFGWSYEFFSTLANSYLLKQYLLLVTKGRVLKSPVIHINVSVSVFISVNFRLLYLETFDCIFRGAVYVLLLNRPFHIMGCLHHWQLVLLQCLLCLYKYSYHIFLFVSVYMRFIFHHFISTDFIWSAFSKQHISTISQTYLSMMCMFCFFSLIIQWHEF